MDKSFYIKNVLKEGWDLTKVNIGFLLCYQIILIALSFLIGATEGNWKLTPLNIIGLILLILGKMGFYNSCLMITTGNKPGFDQLFKSWPYFLSWIIASFLFGIMFGIGLILFIIPGIYVFARFGLFPFFILDKNLGPIDALKQASQASEGIRWELALFFLACLGINILGILLFGIGIFITIPITLIALAIVYYHITGQNKKSIQPEDIEQS